jgi:hypothetical protein
MIAQNLDTFSVEQLVKEFAIAAKEFGSAVLNSDAMRANQTYPRKRAVDDALRSRGHHARLQLVPLLDDNDRLVRYYAAKNLFAIVPGRPRQIIESNAKFWFDPIAADARMMLRMVDSGEYKPE